MQISAKIAEIPCRRGAVASRLAGVAAFTLGCLAVPVAAATPAGTVISNIANIDYQLQSRGMSASSNRVDITVGEIVDFTVTPAPTCGTPTPDGVIAIGFEIHNLGNGHEAFIPGVPIVTGAPAFVVTGVFADTNRNGCYDHGIDQQIQPGGRTDSVVPGGRIRVFVVGTGNAGGGRVTLPITSETGQGGTGTAFTGRGDGGGDAVLGTSGGAVVDISAPLPAPLTASLVKSQSVSSSSGRTEPRAGAIVTYSIEGRFVGTGTAKGAVIADLIPAGTDYVPGSITLDGRAVNDAADGDAGSFDGQRVSVALGDVAAPATRTISFKVRIK